MKRITQYLLCGILLLPTLTAWAKEYFDSSLNSNINVNENDYTRQKYYGGSKYYGKQLCGYPQFDCIKVKHSYSWEKLWPDIYQREMIQRLNRMNVDISNRPWIVVPNPHYAVSYLQLSPFPRYRETGGKRLVLVDLKLQAFAAYDEQGKLAHWGPISAGKDFCPDVNRQCHTPTGHFSIQWKKGADCISTRFPVETSGGAKMPYCMFFFGGFALHGSYALPGYNDSHGCVRLFINDARWLNEEFTKIGTPVIVTQ